MSKNNSKSLSSLRQKLRKYNKEFELDIAKFRENPDQAEDEEDEEKGNIMFCNQYCQPQNRHWTSIWNFSLV
jgi:hypothetical protein